ncbi:MAG: DUF349 domain-containing protein [Gammaproteobacteria bacterium]|nr:DUF349 domain-containing protein [Gammaproteobacteria bacterium]
MIFKALFKPKWQHKDSLVRKRAVQDLNLARAEDREALMQVLRADADAEVRAAALKRITDLDALASVALTDTSEEVRAAAAQRYTQLLCGVERSPVALADRLLRLSATSDLKLIEEIARRGVESELRRAALQRVEREALLGDIALQDADPELRYAAVARIKQKSTLERVAKQARMKDKRVCAAAREKLEQMAADEERPKRLRQQARLACAALEALARVTDWTVVAARLAPIETDWQKINAEWDAVKDGVLDADIAARFAAARAAFDAAFAQHEQALREQREAAAQRDILLLRKGELCEQLERLLRDIRQQSAPVAGDEVALSNALRVVRTAWDEAGGLTGNEEESWRARFVGLVQQVEAVGRDIPHYHTANLALLEIEARVQATLTSAEIVAERDIKGFEKQLAAVVRPQHFVLDCAAEQRIRAALEQLRARRAQQIQKVKDDLATFMRLVSEIAQATEDGQSHAAAELHREAQQLYDSLPASDAAMLRKQEVYRQWQAAAKNVRVLWSWKRWAGAPVKESLAAEMESLASQLQQAPDLERDYHDIADKIRAARDQWKELGATDNAGAKALWERFKNACDAAYAPCEVFFAREREQRKQHAAQKTAICDGLEQFIAQTDWENADWKKIEQLLRTARLEWNGIGAVDRALSNTLNKRFRVVMDDLAARLSAERKLNKSKKETLIRRMEQLADTVKDVLADSPALKDAIATAKQLQNQWKLIGQSAESNSLWNTFRAASDRIFAQREAAHAAQDQQRQEYLVRAQALCAQVAEFARLQGEALRQAHAKVQQAKADFERAGPLPKEAERDITQQFQRACREFEKQEKSAQQHEREQNARLFERKVELCNVLENAAERLLSGVLTSDVAATHMLTAQEAWQALVSLSDDVEQLLNARFQTAAETLHGLQGAQRDNIAAQYLARAQENLASKELLCLRLEIATGIESPPEYRAQRMQYQVDQLARRMRTGETQDAAQVPLLLRQWCFIGPVPSAHADVLRARFERARTAVGAVELVA